MAQEKSSKDITRGGNYSPQDLVEKREQSKLQHFFTFLLLNGAKIYKHTKHIITV